MPVNLHHRDFANLLDFTPPEISSCSSSRAT